MSGYGDLQSFTAHNSFFLVAVRNCQPQGRQGRAGGEFRNEMHRSGLHQHDFQLV